jgi:hypothetical protein
MPAPVLQFKRGNAGVAGTVPALRPGEPAISLNNFDFFIGIDTSVANNKFFGSHRYWTREDGTNSLKLNLVDKGGTNKISIKSPDTLVGTGTYTLPDTNTIIDGYFLKVATDGTLSWDTAGGTNGTFTNPTLTGVTTISGTQLNVSAPSNFTAIATFSNVDINDGTLDGVVIGQASPDAGYFTLVDTDRLISDYSTIGFATATDFHIDSTRVLYNDGAGITLAGIQTIDATTKTTLETILAFDPNNFTTLNVTGIATVGGLIDGNGGLDITGHSELDNLNVSGVSTFAGLADFNGGATIDNLRLGVTADNEIDTASGNLILDSAGGTVEVQDNLTVSGISTFTGAVVANGNVTLGDAAGDTVTVKGTTTFEQSIVGTISTATNANNINITQTTSTDTTTSLVLVANQSTGFQTAFIDSGLTYDANTNNLTLTGDIAVNGGDVTTSATTFNLVNATATNVNFAGAATALVMGAATTGITTVRNNLTVGGNLEVDGNNIQSSTGANAITLSGSDVTVNGNLYVNGSTTQVNTTALTVEDRTIDLGIVNGATPASATTWDLGVLFNYNSGGAKKSAVIWEHVDARFKFASVLASDTDGTTVDTPQLTVTTFAPIEIAELWVNNTCTGGSQQVIGCVGAELQLQNITLDCGTF